MIFTKLLNRLKNIFTPNRINWIEKEWREDDLTDEENRLLEKAVGNFVRLDFKTYRKLQKHKFKSINHLNGRY